MASALFATLPAAPATARTAPPATLPGRATSDSQPASKPGTAQSQRSTGGGMSVVAAHYVLDFGYVVKGTTKVRSWEGCIWTLHALVSMHASQAQHTVSTELESNCL